MALTSTLTDDWSGGMYRGKRAPANAVYDLQNLLINDEGQPFKRGGSAYYSASNAGSALTWLQTTYAPAPKANRTIATGSDAYVLNGSLAPVVLSASHQGRSRVTGAGDFILFVTFNSLNLEIIFYAGSLKTGNYSTGTISYTAGSDQVTGSGTSWLANVDPGMIFEGATFTDFPVVKSVDSNTQITLTRPAMATAAGHTYILEPSFGMTFDAFASLDVPRAFVATAGQRFLVAFGNRIYYSPRGNPAGLDSSSYHEVPPNVSIIGIEGRDDSASVFTTGGVWEITNLSLDDVDDFGNIQQVVQRITNDLVLWDDYGIAGLSGLLVVPAIDDVYLFAPGAQQKTTTGGRGSQYDGGIRALYRSYVAAGYRPGLATVHRSHYLLPILNGSTVVDVLVCRLDHGFAWSRWAGAAAGVAYSVLPATDSAPTKLLGLAGQRVTDLTGCFDPTAGNTTDADGTAPTVQVTTRDYPTGQQPGFVQKIRGRYEMTSVDIPDSFDRADGALGADWSTNPWGLVNGALSIDSNQLAAEGSAVNEYRSWLTRPFTPPLAARVTITARPAANANTTISSALGFLQTVGNGYEARLRYETAGDTVIIDRRDSTSATRILASVPLGSRVSLGDTFGFTVATDGTLSVLVNDAVVGSVNDTTYFHAGEQGYIVAGILDFALVRSSIRMDSTPPSVAVEYSSDQDGGTFTALTETGEQDGGDGWSTSDGSLYQWANVGKRRERIRFRLTLADAAASFVLRSLEILHRPQGRQ